MALDKQARLHILLAEDIEAYMNRIMALFTHLPLEVIPAADGQHAIDYIVDVSRRLDLLVTDLDMPRRTGWQVIEALREHRGEAVPVIMQTGEASYPWVQAQAQALGVVLIDKAHVDIGLVRTVCQVLNLPDRT